MFRKARALPLTLPCGCHHCHHCCQKEAAVWGTPCSEKLEPFLLKLRSKRQGCGTISQKGSCKWAKCSAMCII